MLLGTLGARLLGHLLTGKVIVRAGSGNNKGKGVVRAGSGNKKGKAIVRACYGRPLSSASQKNLDFNTAPPLNKLWTTKILWKWTKI